MSSIGRFQAHRDALKRLENPYEPLSFDRASGGLHVTSRFPIFRLPVELYHRFTRHLSPQDLSTLALVDRDCLQLARCVRFCTIRNPPQPFADHLAGEAETKTLRGIRMCTRHLEFTDKHWVDDQPSIWQAFSSGAPYLTRLECHSTSRWSHVQSILDVAMTLPLTYFSLTMIDCTEESFYGPFIQPQWKLETFVLRLYHNRGMRRVPALLGPLLLTLPTSLRNLVWDHSPVHLMSLLVWFPNGFPRLESLIGSPQEIPMSAYASLRRLVMDIADPRFLIHNLSILTLKELIWCNTPGRTPAAKCIDFLRGHAQLSTFIVTTTLPTCFIEDKLLPLLAEGFKSLSIFRLGFTEPKVSPLALNMIANIGSLNSLWLTAGSQSGILHEWKVDPAQLSSHLSKLLSLKQLVLTRDSYQGAAGQGDAWYYYIRMLPLECDWRYYMLAATRYAHPSDTALNKMTKAWELWHRDMMVKYAQHYFESLLALEWCFLGQIPMACSEGGKAVAEIEFRNLEGDMDTLRQMFGMLYEELRSVSG